MKYWKVILGLLHFKEIWIGIESGGWGPSKILTGISHTGGEYVCGFACAKTLRLFASVTVFFLFFLLLQNPDSAERLGPPTLSGHDSNAELHRRGRRQLSPQSRGRCGVRRGSVTAVISSQMNVASERRGCRGSPLEVVGGDAFRDTASHRKQKKKVPSVRVRADPLPTPSGRHFLFLPDRAVKSAGRSGGGRGGGSSYT